MERIKMVTTASTLRQCYVDGKEYTVGADIDAAQAEEFVKIGFAKDSDVEEAKAETRAEAKAKAKARIEAK